MRRDRSALRHQPTRGALDMLRRRSLAMTFGGALVLTPATIPYEQIPEWLESGPVHWVLLAVQALALLSLVGGLLSLANTVRMHVVLAKHPWRPWDAVYREVGAGPTPDGQPTLLLGPDRGHVLTLVSFNWRWGPFDGADAVWFAGDPGRGGVVSTEGGRHLVWARRPLIPAFRTYLGRQAATGR